MGKKAVIAIFSVCVVLAVYLYVQRDPVPLREKVERADDREPRIVLENFVYYRYAGTELKGKLTARSGYFFEPNEVNLEGEIEGVRHREDGPPQTFGAELATVYFEAENMSEMMDEPDLDKAELSGFVEVGVKNHLLTTDYAEYLSDEDLVWSSRPVRVEGPNRVFRGEDGFFYRVAEELLEMKGGIEGTVIPDERK